MPKDSFYYRDGDVELGPYQKAGIASLVARGLVNGRTLVRTDEDPNWSPAELIFPDLFAVAPVGPAGAWSDTEPHPWRRFIARRLDTVLVGFGTLLLIGVGAEAFAADAAAGSERVTGLLLGLLFEPLAIPGNALLIGLTGSSIGKFAFGVRVLRDGAPMGVWRALRRELAVWLRGLGLGIPIITLITLVVSMNRLQANRIASWDKAQNLTVLHRPESAASTVVMWIIALLLIFVLTDLALAGGT